MEKLNYVTLEEFNNYIMLMNDIGYLLEEKYKEINNLEDLTNDELDDQDLTDLYNYIYENSNYYAIEKVRSIIYNSDIEDLKHIEELCDIFKISVSDLDD